MKNNLTIDEMKSNFLLPNHPTYRAQHGLEGGLEPSFREFHIYLGQDCDGLDDIFDKSEPGDSEAGAANDLPDLMQIEESDDNDDSSDSGSDYEDNIEAPSDFFFDAEGSPVKIKVRMSDGQLPDGSAQPLYLRLQLFYLANCFKRFIPFMFMFMYRPPQLKSGTQ